MVFWAMMAVCGFVCLVCLDRLLAFAMRVFEPHFPNEMAGPDGWLVDTQRHCGVFDRRSLCARSDAARS